MAKNGEKWRWRICLFHLSIRHFAIGPPPRHALLRMLGPLHFSLMSLQRKREKCIILHTGKILQNKQFVARPRFGNLAIIPPSRKNGSAADQSLFDCSFAIQGPKLWNKIPFHLNIIRKLEQFKGPLTQFRLSLPDMPPIRGYTPLDSNSFLVGEITEKKFCSGEVG